VHKYILEFVESKNESIINILDMNRESVE